MRVRATVRPAARREKLEVIRPDAFEISVREKAERNEANERVRVLLARHFRVHTKAVKIVSGQRSSRKIFEIGKKG